MGFRLRQDWLRHIWKAGIPDGCAILVSWVWQEIQQSHIPLRGALLARVGSLPSLGSPQHILSKAFCKCAVSHFGHIRLFATSRTGVRRLLCLWDSAGRNTAVGCRSLLWGNLPEPGIEPASLMSPALTGRFLTTNATWEALRHFANRAPF